MKKLLIILSLVMVAGACISAPRKARRRLQLAASGAFSPSDLGSKLAVWLDGSDNSTLLDASDNVCTNGVAIKTWSDKSGNSRDAVQVTVSLQPTFRTATQNSLSVVRSDGDDRMLILLASSVFRNKTQGHIFIVAKDADQTGGNSYHMFAGWTRNADGSTRFAVFGKSGTTYKWLSVGRRLDADTPVVSANAIASGHNLIHGFADWSAGYLRCSLNSSVYTSVAYPSGAGSSSDTDSNQSAIFGYGFHTTEVPANSEIAEVIAVNATMTATEITNVETYLKNKWGL